MGQNCREDDGDSQKADIQSSVPRVQCPEVRSKAKAVEKGATESGPGRLRLAFVTELGPTELGPSELGPTELGPVLKYRLRPRPT